VLKRRLATLASAPSMRDMDGVPGKCHHLHGDRAGQYSINLWGSFRLIFTPDHDPLRQLADGGTDLTNVTKIIIHEVVDYHGD
jgi:toxin HigB-1